MSSTELPPGWASVRLADVLSEPLINGRSVKTLEGGFPVLRLTALKPVGIDFSEQKAGAWTAEEAAPFLATEGDFLLSRGNGSRRLVGRGALVRHVPQPCAFPDTMIRVRVHAGAVAPGYLQQIWDSQVVRSQIEKAARTTAGIYKINQEILEGIELPLPPLAEQHRIVESLEDHLSRLEVAVRSLRDSQRRAHTLMKVLVMKVLRGELVGSSAEDEAVSDLLAQVDSEVKGATGGRRSKSEGVTASAFYVGHPSRWSLRPLGSLCRNIEYGTSAKTHADPAVGDVPVLRMGNIQNGRLDLGNLKYLPGEHPDVSKLPLRNGDVLFNRTNSAELVGKAAVYSSHTGAATFASYLIRCQLAQGIEPEWVSLCINSPEGRRYIASVASQQVGQANVNGTKLSAFPIPIPPQAEQVRILEVLDLWHDSIDRSADVSQSALRRSGNLRSAVLTKAFTGKLVPQDPADEPASVLLDRIRAERNAQGAKPKRGRRAVIGKQANPGPPPPRAAANPIPTDAVQLEF